MLGVDEIHLVARSLVANLEEMVLIVVKKRGSTTEQAIAFPDKTANQVTVRQLKEAVVQKFKVSALPLWFAYLLMLACRSVSRVRG
jgi:hypothetical protein